MAIIFTDRTTRSETTQRRRTMRINHRTPRPASLIVCRRRTSFHASLFERFSSARSVAARPSTVSRGTRMSWSRGRHGAPNAIHRTPRVCPAHTSPHMRAYTPNDNRRRRHGRAHELRGCESHCGHGPIAAIVLRRDAAHSKSDRFVLRHGLVPRPCNSACTHACVTKHKRTSRYRAVISGPVRGACVQGIIFCVVAMPQGESDLCSRARRSTKIDYLPRRDTSVGRDSAHFTFVTPPPRGRTKECRGVAICNPNAIWWRPC